MPIPPTNPKSWKAVIRKLKPQCEFHPPADPAAIRAAEKKLNVVFPDALKNLLLETNGVDDWLVLSIERILETNVEMRTYPDFPELYMPFDNLLFFGGNGGGDLYGYRILNGKVDADNVYEWEHENDSRNWVASALNDFLWRKLTP